MGKSLLFLVAGLTVLTGIIHLRNNERAQLIPERSKEYFLEQQARNISKSLIDNAVETMKADNDWVGTISLDEVMNTDIIEGRSVGNIIGYMTGKAPVLIQNQVGNGNGNNGNGNNGNGNNGNGNNGNEEENESSNSLNMSGSLTSYTMNSNNIPADNSVASWDQYKVLLVSVSEFDGIEVTTEVLMQRDSFSKYSYMTDSELSSLGSEIWFMGADNIYGPIHTNGTFKMSGSPSFYGLITSPNMWDAHNTNPTNPNFYGGENFNAPEKTSPSNYEMTKLSNAANAGGLTFEADIEVEFFENDDVGHVQIREVTTSSCGWGCTTTTYSDWEDHEMTDFNGIISTTGKASVSGTVLGSATLHSEEEIEITGDIEYFTSPLDDSSSTDILGLVSEGDVVVDRYAHSSSGAQDLTIHASIMALNTSFYVENYSSGGSRGTINLLGGIVQKNRGPVGTFSGSSIVSGFSKNYQYDNRLRSTIPPSFPRESIFSIVYWKDKVVNKTES